jgi:hypothetical protein
LRGDVIPRVGHGRKGDFPKNYPKNLPPTKVA